MSEVPVVIHLPGRRVGATLSTSRAESSYGKPVLVVEGGKSFEGRAVAHGPGDVTSYGLAATLLLEVSTSPEARTLLERWEGLAGRLRLLYGLSMAAEWLAAGGWRDGSVWVQNMGSDDERYLADELDRCPLEREVVRHVTDNEDVEEFEGASWTFPDGSGVVEIGDTWDVFNPRGRTEYGRIVRERS